MSPVALIIGGAEGAFGEFYAASILCGEVAPLASDVFAVNDMIAAFPHIIDHAVTLHPGKLIAWLRERHKAWEERGQGACANFTPPLRSWCHREGVRHFTDWSPDWGGSSGLFAVKVARELGYRRVILCGVPMTVEGGHFRRRQRWAACHGFRPAWERHAGELRPYLRSMSGWTRELFGAPGPGWLGN